MERKNQGIELPNALLWEIKNYYPEEYAVGIEALSIIVEKLNIVLSEDEAGFIAIHIVNAEMGNFNSRGYDIVVMTKISSISSSIISKKIWTTGHLRLRN